MIKYINKLERVQRRATRLIGEISQLSYEERLQQCRLTTLETRINRGAVFQNQQPAPSA